MSYPSPLHVPEENSIDLRSSEISELYHQSILPLCNQVQRLTNQMEQWVSSLTKSVKMETGVSQSEQRGEPMHKEDSVDIFPQVVAHEMKLRTFSGTPDNSDQINVGEWIAEAKCNIRLLGYKGTGSVNYILKFITGPAQKRGLWDQGLQSGLRWYLRGQPGMSYEELVQVAAEESKKTIKEKNPSKGVVTAINECSPMVKEVRETLNPPGSEPQESGVEKMLAELRVDIQAVKTDLVQIKGSPEVKHFHKGRPLPFQGECYICGQWGHRAATCWHRNQGRGRGGPPRWASQQPGNGVKTTGVSEIAREEGNGQPLLWEAHQGVGLHSPEGLVLKAANGGSIPYLGYMLVDVEILEYKIEHVEVLVRKGEQSSATQAPGLIGMNVLRQCREVLVKDFGPHYVDCSIIKGNRYFSKCFQEIESIHRWQQKDHVGFASSTRGKPTRIPANCRQAVSIYIRSLRRCPKLEVLIEPMQAGYGKGVATVANVSNSCMWLKRNWHVGVARGADLCPQQETAEEGDGASKVIHRMHLRAAPRVADGSDGTDTYDGDDEDDAGCPVGDPRPDSGENSRHEVDTQGSNEDLDPVADSSSSSSEEES
ncbi:hypothetical protein Hamer_G026951, partial [Homarus americanus]